MHQGTEEQWPSLRTTSMLTHLGQRSPWMHTTPIVCDGYSTNRRFFVCLSLRRMIKLACTIGIGAQALPSCSSAALHSVAPCGSIRWSLSPIRDCAVLRLTGEVM